jgi:hypothetical protein
VSIVVEDASDQQLIGRQIYGIVRAFDPTAVDEPLLIHLHEVISYETRLCGRDAEFLVATAAKPWHGPRRLLLAAAVALLYDAPSFADRTAQSVIGSGRVTLL